MIDNTNIFKAILFVFCLFFLNNLLVGQKQNSVLSIIDGGGTKANTITLKMGTGIYKEWMAYNLGADTNLVANYPVKEIHGNYYRWGRSTIVADASTPSGAIAGWPDVNNISLFPSITGWNAGTESVPIKGSQDPCPSGFRIPTKTEWNAAITNNLLQSSGSLTDNDTNFTSVFILTNPDMPTQYLVLPAAGIRDRFDGTLYARGIVGSYWSSTYATNNGQNGYIMLIQPNGTIVEAGVFGATYTYGASLRCIKE